MVSLNFFERDSLYPTPKEGSVDCSYFARISLYSESNKLEKKVAALSYSLQGDRDSDSTNSVNLARLKELKIKKDESPIQLNNEIKVTVDNNSNVKAIVEFKQQDIIDPSDGKTLPKKLEKIILRFEGLCEIICNKVLVNDLLDKGSGDFLKNKLTAEKLDKKGFSKSHIVSVYCLFTVLIACLFKIYPNNIMSTKDQRKLLKNKKKEINEDVFSKALNNVEDGKTLKMMVFQRHFFSFFGHSMLVKKIGDDNFIFFDPDAGEHRGLSKAALILKINEQLSSGEADDLFFMDGAAYIKKLKSKKIITIKNLAKKNIQPS